MHESHNPLPKRRKRGAPLGNKRGLGNRGGGRKTIYSPKMAEIARRCCERGMTDIEVADILGIGLATLYRWKAQHPAFSRVFKLGKAEADDRVERSLYSRAVGYDYIAEKAAMTRHGQKTMRYRAHIPPDTTAAVWYLKNRRPDRWRDSFRHEHTASPYDAIEDPAELRALLTKQAQALGLIAPTIIDITPNAPSSAHAESSSEALQTPTIAAKHERRAQGRPTTLPDVGAAPNRDLKRNNGQ
jgi:transposase-like protein